MTRVVATAAVRPHAIPTAREPEALAHEHPLQRPERGAERHPNPDLARPLGDGIGDDTVDAHDPEHERHRAGNRQHHQRERGLRHGTIVQIAQRADPRERHAAVDRPDRALDLVQEPGIAGSTAADDERDARAER